MKKICLLLLLCMGLWASGMGCPAPPTDEKTEETSTEQKAEQKEETAAEVGDEPEPAAEPEPAPEPTPEPDAAPEPTPEPDAAPEPTPEPDAAPEPTPDGEVTTEPVQDGGEMTTEPTPDGGEVTTEPTPDGGETTTEPTPDGEVTTEPTPDAGETTPETTNEGTQETTGDQPPQNTPSASAATQITAALAGTTGSIDGAAVTYLKPKVGNDPEGFFLQATQAGPAIFVVATLSSLSPQLKVGDIVSLTTATINTTTSGSNAGRTATVDTFTNLKVLGGGYDVTQLTQDISQKTDVVTNVGDYEYELVKTELKITSGFSSAGSGFVAASAETASITGNTDLQFRIPAGASGQLSIAEELGIINGCTIEVSHTPMWRFAGRAQISANAKTEVTVKSCPLPTVASAKALSATTVAVTFSSPIDPASLMANGSQFAFDNGLVASAAALTSPDVVEVTTGSQTTGTNYTVTVGVTIKDRVGQALDATKNTATFAGFSAGAQVVINEVNPDVASGCDLIELRVIAGGSMDGFTLYNANSKVLTFASFTVKKNDLIVVHFNANNTSCYATKPNNETSKVDELPKSTVPTNYDTAYDWYSTRSGFGTRSGTLSVRDLGGKYVDAMMYFYTGQTPINSSLTEADKLAQANQWKPTSGSAPTMYDATAFAKDAATSAGKDRAKSFQRKNNTDTDTLSDWDFVTSTIGALNSGQTALP